MYIETWVLIVAIAAIVILFVWVSRISNIIDIITKSNNPTYEQDININKRIDEINKWLDFYHPDKDKDIEKRDKYISWKYTESIAKAWCKAKKMTTEETKNYIKNYKKTWSSQYDESHKHKKEQDILTDQ